MFGLAWQQSKKVLICQTNIRCVEPKTIMFPTQHVVGHVHACSEKR